MLQRIERGPGSRLGAAVALCLALIAMLGVSRASAATLPPGFTESVVISGLAHPMDVRFASDGRVFVAEKSGVIKVYSGLDDTTPSTFADLRTQVHDFWDRGLMSIALSPSFPSDPYVYGLYAHDAAIGGTAPRWGDGCPTPPGANDDGCVISGRLVRLQAAGDVMTGSPQVLIEDWCQQYPSHSVGTLEFGADGMLYVSGGDGASFTFADWGQDGSPLNPCGDPPGGVGAVLAPPSAEGGALRSQDLRTTGDPVGLDGTVLRVDPTTGQGAPGNPFAGSSDANARRIIAYGLRNPFRFTLRPSTNEIWVGDVGWSDWEEINVIPSATDSVAENFGWPCYEGPSRQAGYDAADLAICENLYAQAGAVTSPYFSYHHSARVVPNESCPTGSSSVSGLSFQFGGASYPGDYDGALYFADFARNCIWVLPKGADGRPAPGLVRTFVAGASGPVNLRRGPNGDLFYVDYSLGTIRRITYGNTPPKAVATATPSSGPVPLSVTVSGSLSSDPQGGPLTYSWDLNGDGAFGDATGVTASTTFGTAGPHEVGLRVSDSGGLSGTSSVFVVGGTDIALNRTATASSTAGAGFEPFRANDGSSSTRWMSADLSSQYWIVDLGATVPVGSVSVNWGPVYCATYFMSTSLDGTNWTTAAQEAAPAPGWRATVFMPRTARYVRVTCLGRSNVGGISIWDAHVFGSGGNTPPSPTISTPTAGTTWQVGTVIGFSGSATDPEDGTIPASRLSWSVLQQHCPSNCHTHSLQDFPGVTSGSFTAPDHEYPSYIDLSLTSTDSAGASATVTRRLDPRTAALTLQSSPSGLQIALNSGTAATPFTRSVIVGSSNSISAPTPQTLGGTRYDWTSWSNGGAQSQNVLVNGPLSLTATYAGTDVTGPTLVGRSPAPGSNGNSTGTNVVATFSEAMNPATVTSASFSLVAAGTTAAVPATITSNAARTAFTLDPSSALARNKNYTVQVTTAVRDAAGNPMATAQSWGFRTGNR